MNKTKKEAIAKNFLEFCEKDAIEYLKQTYIAEDCHHDVLRQVLRYIATLTGSHVKKNPEAYVRAKKEKYLARFLNVIGVNSKNDIAVAEEVFDKLYTLCMSIILSSLKPHFIEHQRKEEGPLRFDNYSLMLDRFKLQDRVVQLENEKKQLETENEKLKNNIQLLLRFSKPSGVTDSNSDVKKERRRVNANGLPGLAGLSIVSSCIDGQGNNLANGSSSIKITNESEEESFFWLRCSMSEESKLSEDELSFLLDLPRPSV